MPALFDFVNDLSYKKENLLNKDPDYEGMIKQYIINRAFSMGIDTVMYANDMNKCQNIDNKMFYEYYLHALRPAKRFNKWLKQSKLDYVEDIQKVYSLSYKKAVDAANILSQQQLEEIRAMLDEGGFEKN